MNFHISISQYMCSSLRASLCIYADPFFPTVPSGLSFPILSWQGYWGPGNEKSRGTLPLSDSPQKFLPESLSCQSWLELAISLLLLPSGWGYRCAPHGQRSQGLLMAHCRGAFPSSPRKGAPEKKLGQSKLRETLLFKLHAPPRAAAPPCLGVSPK